MTHTTDKSKEPVSTKAKALFVVLATLYWLFATPFVLMKIWGWFIFSYYSRYPVSYSEAMTVAVFISLAKMLLFPAKAKRFETMGEFKDYIYDGIAHPWAVLFFAYILKSIISLL